MEEQFKNIKQIWIKVVRVLLSASAVLWSSWCCHRDAVWRNAELIESCALFEEIVSYASVILISGPCPVPKRRIQNNIIKKGAGGKGERSKKILHNKR